MISTKQTGQLKKEKKEYGTRRKINVYSFREEKQFLNVDINKE